MRIRQDLIGARVEVVKDTISSKFVGKKGKITSIGNEVLPIHVTLDGENHETDFTVSELRIIGRR
jgi:RNase P/RNase MRP subunit p29